jgi:hypothetical protein
MTSTKEGYMQIQDGLPAFIVGLPQDMLEADLAKSKFADTVAFLKKMVPEIEEARCKIKVVHGIGKKSRYQVDVSIITPYVRHAYTGSGRDLARMFDEMGESLRKRFAREKPLKKQRGSIRQN